MQVAVHPGSAKPENVMVGVNGHVKILDFGLAKIVDQRNRMTSRALDSTQAISAGGTGEGIILGTPAYMSPEQARGEPVDSRSDVFSFGVMLYETVTGHATVSGPDDAGQADLYSRPDARATVSPSAGDAVRS